MYRCGIDIGGTSIKFGVFKEGVNDHFFQIPTPKEMDQFVIQIKQAITKYYSLNEIEKYIVSIPGISDKGIVVYAPNTNILGLNIYHDLSIALNNQNILVENDANIQALVEAKVSKLDDLLLITLGTGCGGGIILDGKLLNKNGYAGEIGHIKVSFGKYARKCGCGKIGCAEAYVSAKNMVISYNELMKTNYSAKEIFHLAKQGDKLALKTVRQAARYLAILIADIISVLGIKEVRIAGGLSNAGEYFMKMIRFYYPFYAVKNMEKITIKTAKLKSKSGAIAAKYL